MEFLNFFAERLNLTPSQAGRLLEEALGNYRPTRDYSRRMLDSNATGHSSTAASALSALAPHRRPQANGTAVPCLGHAHLQQ